jgi:hypothetical protein
MGSLACYACCGKNMLGQIHEKMATPKSALGGGRFSASDSTTIGNDVLTCNDPCTPIKDCWIVVGNGYWDNAHIYSTCLAGVKSWAESQIPPCNMPNIRVGAQKARAPPPSSFPHTMLNVKGVKDNMQPAFIEKFLPTVRSRLAYKQDICTSRVCRTRAQTIYVTSAMFS